MGSTSLADGCVPTTFSPTIFGAEVLSVSASLVTNYSLDIPDGFRFTAPARKIRDAQFCNVTVTYTHPGYGDKINVESWLPIDNWNGRLQAEGGGGWAAGRFELSYAGLAGAMFDGYASTTTDGGLWGSPDADSWALKSPGNVDWYTLENFASRCLNDQAIIGKSVVESFYGRPPSYSYWNGCSQGGRQGLMLAQRFPKAYDGIVAGAPAIYWSNNMLNSYWPEHIMRTINEYPNVCELDAITAAVISKCDGLDGLTDGIVENVDECTKKFNPYDLVGTTVDCGNTTVKITKAAAQVAKAAWEGIVSPTGEHLVYPNFNLADITHEELLSLLHASKQEYGSIIDTADPDLSEFKKAGGKLLSFHGLTDNIIPPKGTEQYYREVSKKVDNVEDFYRYFEIPGLAHCLGGPGQPESLFAQLQAWVEDGVAPDSSPVSFSNSKGETQNRILCPYPRKAKYNSSCGNAAKEECWSCVAQKSTESKIQHPEL
ncbi:hypothetical protein Daesc_004804 [Daldinia eschscholtzii]|uniref:Carboxylic ester hydrolase n=1 Tax=Daldinia eschscholtzii TaxID=292717 RepID=A0AAX6MQC9_9PEZI